MTKGTKFGGLRASRPQDVLLPTKPSSVFTMIRPDMVSSGVAIGSELCIESLVGRGHKRWVSRRSQQQ